MPSWPYLIPKLPQAKGFEERLASTVLRSSIDAGPARTRQRFTAGVTEIIAVYYFNEDELEIFDDFFLTDCAGGVLRFDWFHPRLNRYVVARFRGLPDTRPVGPGKYFTQVKLEIMP